MWRSIFVTTARWFVSTAAKTEVQAEKTIAAVCIQSICSSYAKIELEHQGLTSWLDHRQKGQEQQKRLTILLCEWSHDAWQTDQSRDSSKLRNQLASDQFATYVLFIELDPHQVDGRMFILLNMKCAFIRLVWCMTSSIRHWWWSSTK